LVERLKNGEQIIVAEGYLFAFQRRCYLKAGSFVPEVVLEHPDLVKQQYREFIRAGSDVVLAFTYYAHRVKMRLIGREEDLVKANRTALRLAREVADETGTLMAGNICNSTVFDKDDLTSKELVKSQFKEQIEWAMEFKADFIVAETFSDFEEAMIALEAIKNYGRVPAVVTMASHQFNINGDAATKDGYTLQECCKQLEDAGAAVVGLNCTRGPLTMLPIMEKIRKTCKGPIAALPVAYRTTTEEPTFQSLTDPSDGSRIFPDDLECKMSCCKDFVNFGEKCKEIGIQYVGICCGNESKFTRSLAESLGRKPGASRYSTDMSQHYTFGNDPSFKKCYTVELKAAI
ncbi:betaine--homocysteine S-methyltransferase 1-like, partial [Anneissia japonica]|uniref:betaine--homocysteine S-methyltransferase 1-like n=1 Tax=Anneissia japonica TaxID=1529436 RepID=UPI001425AFC7